MLLSHQSPESTSPPYSKFVFLLSQMCTFFAPNKRNLLAAPPWTRLPRRRHDFLQDLRLISKYLFFGCPRIPARTPPSSFPLAARMRSSHTRKKCFFFALLSRKTRILPALLILQVVFALYVRTSNLRNLPSFFFFLVVQAQCFYRCLLAKRTLPPRRRRPRLCWRFRNTLTLTTQRTT